ncbi:hypothetical protein LINGRAHAP2_LOCUS15437, partial [Linum grandiflorum]
YFQQFHEEPITSGFDNSAPEVSTSCKEVNESYLIRLTSKRRTVRTYGFVTASGSISASIPECYL